MSIIDVNQENETEIAVSSKLEYRKVQGLVGESSFSIVLPKSFAIALGIGKGDFVKVYTEHEKIIIERAD